MLQGILISLLSITENTKEQLNVFILTGDFSKIKKQYVPIEERDRRFLEKQIQRANPKSLVILLDASEYVNKELGNSINLKNFYTPYTLLRLFLDKFKWMPDKILYLDADTIVMGDIKELYDINIDNYEYAGAKDYLGRVFINRNYINAGVLLLNMNQIRATGLFVKCRYLLKIKKLAFPDQDALNKMAMAKFFLDSRFNEQRKLRKNTLIRHYCKSIRWLPVFHTINVKPWDIASMHKKQKVYVHDSLLIKCQKLVEVYEGE